jgi:hypothetical protein
MLLLRLLLHSLYLLTTVCSTSMSIHPRQETETRVLDPLTSSLQLQEGASATVPSPTTSYRLEIAKTPIDLADTIGLIMPIPWSKVYVGRLGGLALCKELTM